MSIPCIDCITLSICKARLNGGNMMDLMCLAETCSLLKSFIDPRNNEGKSVGNLLLVVEVEEFLCKNIQYNKEPF